MEETGPPPTRWEVELEFVQGLANPMYVNFLAQQKFLEDPDFLRYLDYLDYWRHMPHVKFIAYPNCLLMLTLLKQPLFRAEIAKVEVAKLLMDGFFRKWQGVTPETVKENNEGSGVRSEQESPVGVRSVSSEPAATKRKLSSVSSAVSPTDSLIPDTPSPGSVPSN